MENKTHHAEVIERIARMTGLYRYQVKKVLDAVTDLIVTDLIQRKEILFPALGKFRMRFHCARKGSHPQTLKELDIPERYLPRFIWSRNTYEHIKRETRCLAADKNQN